jgi:hypothetical protein
MIGDFLFQLRFPHWWVFLLDLGLSIVCATSNKSHNIKTKDKVSLSHTIMPHTIHAHPRDLRPPLFPSQPHPQPHPPLRRLRLLLPLLLQEGQFKFLPFWLPAHTITSTVYLIFTLLICKRLLSASPNILGTSLNSSPATPKTSGYTSSSPCFLVGVFGRYV